MRKFLFLLCAVLPLVATHAQRSRNGVWIIPSSCFTSQINGLAIGPISGCFKKNGNTKQTVNGIEVEIFGAGSFLWLAGGPLDLNDTVAGTQTVNGICVSPGGIGGYGVVVNGLNLSGLYTFTKGVNGISTSAFCRNGYMNGISIGFFNETIKTNGLQIAGIVNGSERVKGCQIGSFNITNDLHGLQIGVYNRTKEIKGVQIGLWNKNSKRALPFLNFQF